MDEDHTLTVYSDYVCPFCYLGKASMEAYVEGAENPPDVEWRAFDLRGHKRGPDGEIREDVDDGKDEEYYERARRNVERLRERYGVEMDPDATPDVDSWDAQKAALYVETEYDDGTAVAFHDAVFDAYWQAGRDIGDPDVLAEIAADVGVDPDGVRAAIDDDDLDARLAERFEEASERGIAAVPTFVYGEYVARGAVPPEQIERLVEGA